MGEISIGVCPCIGCECDDKMVEREERALDQTEQWRVERDSRQGHQTSDCLTRP